MLTHARAFMHTCFIQTQHLQNIPRYCMLTPLMSPIHRKCQLSSCPWIKLSLLCRYIAFFSLRGIAEWAMASGKLFAKGVGLKEAAEVEAPMVEQLGMLKGMDRPEAWTSGLNWYR